MTDEFLNSFSEFQKYASHEEFLEAVLNIEYLFYEQQAAELELPTDYFIQEFILK
jgi:hypothetical protein